MVFVNGPFGLPALTGLARRLSPCAVGVLRPAAAPLSALTGVDRWGIATSACSRSGQALSARGCRVAARSNSSADCIHRRGIHATAASSAAAKRDYYEVLGLKHGADEKEIKKAYAGALLTLAVVRRANPPSVG
jgi:hypothetical protein